MSDEWFPLVDADGRTVGRATRREVHGNPNLMHPVVHCIVTNRDQALLLQLRSPNKDIQPGKWDTSVGGHVAFGESIEDAVRRELEEELGLRVQLSELEFLYRYVMKNSVETELVTTFHLSHEGPFLAQPEEIDRLAFMSHDQIRARLQTGFFTANFEDEFARFLEVTSRHRM